jgi:porin
MTRSIEKLWATVTGLAIAGLVMAGPALAEDPKTPAITYDAVLTTDFDDLTSGGLKPGMTIQKNVDLTAVWKGGDGWEAHGYVLGDFNGDFSSRRTGDAQGVDNISAIPAWRLFEAYVKRTYDDGHLVSSFGMMNLNNVFDVQKFAKLFLNSSQGIGPEFAQTGPSIFPISGLGTMTSWIIDPQNTVKVGVFDGVPGDPMHRSAFVAVKLSARDGANYIGEYKRTWDGGYLKLDHWGYTAAYPRIDGTGTSRDNSGTYGQLAVTLTREAQDPTQGLKAWARMGDANGALEPVDHYRGFGFFYVGPIDRHDVDQLGFAFAQIHYGSAYRAATPGTGAYETDYELTYQAALTKAITLQPDFQFVHHPSGRGDIKDDRIVMLRTAVDFMAF